MVASSQPIVPPAPKVHEKDLPGLRLLFEFSRNTIAAQPNNAFDDLIVRRRILGIESLLLNDPEGVRHVLTTAMDKYKRPVAASRILSALGGSGLFLAEGAQWRLQRRMLAPLFTPANVDILLPHFMEAAAGLATRLDGSPRANLALAFQETALDAVLRALFSLPDSEQRARIAAMVRRYLAGPGRPRVLDGIARTEHSFGFAMRTRRRFHKTGSETIDAIIAARRKSPNAAAGGDLLDLLIAARDSQSGEALSETEVRDQCSTMLVAGYETTARLLFWSVYLLTLDLKEQVNLHQEIADFPPERVQKLDDVQHWPRLRQTLHEALRLYPPVAYLAREALTDDVVAGEPIQPGTQIWISPWVMHRHRRFWDHPTAFVPERFAGKPSHWSNNGTFLPFGAGPRICIGAAFAMPEAQIMLATVLTRFKITLAERRPVLPVARITTAPSHEPWFHLERI